MQSFSYSTPVRVGLDDTKTGICEMNINVVPRQWLSPYAFRPPYLITDEGFPNTTVRPAGATNYKCCSGQYSPEYPEFQHRQTSEQYYKNLKNGLKVCKNSGFFARNPKCSSGTCTGSEKCFNGVCQYVDPFARPF